MHVLTRQRLQFRHRETGEKVTVPNGTITEVPDWVRDSAMFALAERSGVAEVVSPGRKEAPQEAPSPARRGRRPIVGPEADRARAAAFKPEDRSEEG